MYQTSTKDAWITERVNPFINIPFYYKDRYLCGLYEYYDEYKNHEELEEMKKKVNEFLINKGYKILNFEEGMAAIKISRSILNDYDKFKDKLSSLINDAVYINDKVVQILCYNLEYR